MGVNFSSPLDFYPSNKKIHEMKISYTEGEVQQTFLKSRGGLKAHGEQRLHWMNLTDIIFPI